MLSRFGLLRVLCGLLLVSGSTLPGTAQGLRPALHAAKDVSDIRPATGSFTVVALRVEFQPDTTRFTTGDGTFSGDPYDGLVPAVDPLPHDAGYFGAHLDALAHYVARVSDGQADIHPILLPEVVRVSHQMGDYTPLGLDASSDDQLAKLSGLIEEAWSLADREVDFALPPDIESDRVLFVLFHAGVGRDIELVGTTLDKTPLDIPSIYLDAESLGRLGSPAIEFKGLPVSSTAIIPRTETRRGFDFVSDEPFLVELTTNGLLAASFFNFLGVPDLFDTSSGESAIGPFGLMDPLGIFAYGGLIPPEPSAWTRVFLGWSVPVEIRRDLPSSLSLRAVGGETSDVARIWISDAEYFLVENRHRDVGSDGLVVQVWNRGTVTEHRFENGDPEFNSTNIDGFPGGVLVSADEYDWALPGGLDENDNPLVGGALIWHVDERRIEETIGTNAVNADRARRGVDLEEADSGQDLGYPSPGFFGPALDQGSPFDFFYEGNPVTVITSSGREVTLYENRFGADTYPDSRSNGGGPSFIEIADFSAPGPEMSFVVRRTAGGSVEPDEEASFSVLEATGIAFRTDVATGVKSCADASDPFYVVSGMNLADGSAILVVADETGFVEIYQTPGSVGVQPACYEDRLLAVTEEGGATDLAVIDVYSGDIRRISLGGAGDSIPGSPITVVGDTAYLISTSGDGGGLAIVDLVEGSVRFTALDGRPSSIAYTGSGSIGVGLEGTVQLFDGAGDRLGVWDVGSQDFGPVVSLAFGSDADGLLGVAASRDRFALLESDGTARVFDSGAEPADSAPRPALADLDGDGRLDAVFAAGRRLTAFTRGGAVVTGFPIELGSSGLGQPLVSTDDPRTRPWLTMSTDEGYVSMLDLEAGGAVPEGFPLPAAAVITPAWHEDRLYTASASGDIRVWELTGYGRPIWDQLYGDGSNRSSAAEPSGSPEPTGDGLLVESETYNWPNPVSEGRTNFRMAVTEDVSVEITIIDMAGSSIDELHVDRVRAGAPFELSWKTSAASGLYFARVTATAESGRSESRLVRFAIIR